MNLLAVETSGNIGSVALLSDKDGEAVIDFPEGTRHGTALVPSIERLLKKDGIKPDDIDVIAVSIGPGSYTGLRVGLVCAKMICSISGADLVAVPTFDAIASSVSGEQRRICVVGDARRGEVYTAFYNNGDGHLERRSEFSIMTAGDLKGELVEETYLVGDGIPVLLPLHDRTGIVLADETEWLPRADAVARIGLKMYTEGVRSDRYATEPMYLRRPAAEEKWVERGASSL